VLYSLYKFAEACEGYYQFTLTRLLDHTVESVGISPTQIFGFDRDDMERFLNGLSARYPEFINATFTHDLDKITLREDKTSADVLSLF
jgi:phosphoadenosine phosphosulfate reductase